MRRAALFSVLALMIACGDSPTIPSTPPPPQYPSMVGGWGGTWTQTWVTTFGPGSQTCNETWLVTVQNAGAFDGTYQRSGDDCGASGMINGGILVSGEVDVRHRGATGSDCVLLSGDGVYKGFVSPAGGLTAQTAYSVRCPFNRGTLDYSVTATLSMNRR